MLRPRRLTGSQQEASRLRKKAADPMMASEQWTSDTNRGQIKAVPSHPPAGI
ncbi:MAG: hypothetical protein ACOX85_00590 [Candidatus Pararuminococcus gallinarum]